MVEPRFRGCKLALIHGDCLLVYTRDDKPGIDFPGLLDLPGGGREGCETPEECVLRELHEEFGIRLPPDRLAYRRRYATPHLEGHGWFFAGTVHAGEIAGISFGEEGTHWELMKIADFLAHPAAIPHLKARLEEYLGFLAAT